MTEICRFKLVSLKPDKPPKIKIKMFTAAVFSNIKKTSVTLNA